MSTVKLVLYDYSTPSLNTVAHAHWRSVRKHKGQARDRLMIACIQQYGRVPQFIGPVKLKVTRFYAGRKRRMDHENYVGGLKPLIDAMRASKRHANQQTKAKGGGSEGGIGIFGDDDTNLMHEHHQQVRVKRDELNGYDQAMMIEIEGERSQ